MNVPDGTTHEWYYPNGSWRGYIRVLEWVYYFDERNGWIAVAKCVDSLSGTVKPI